MSGIAIYVEGGGDRKDSRNQLRLGMDAFLDELKAAARAKSVRWKLVACGGRDEAFRAFGNGAEDSRFPFRILLVDAEEAVSTSPVEHLRRRDNWGLDVDVESFVHLMVQTMEAWIVADPEALSNFYGQKFNPNALPRSENLELISKKEIADALANATRISAKGEYHKIQHVQKLLRSLNPEKVRRRCPNCARLFDFLRVLIASH